MRSIRNFSIGTFAALLAIPFSGANALHDVHCNFRWSDNPALNVKQGTEYVTKNVRRRELERIVAMGNVVARVAVDRGNHCQLNHPENTRIDVRIEKVDYRLDRSGRVPNCADLNAMVECRGSRWIDPPVEEAQPTATAGARPNIIVSEFSLNPSTPVSGQPVQVRIGAYNNGTAPAGPYRVEWYPGENYPEPACTWNVPGTNARGGRILNCVYPGYPSWYASIRTKVVVDAGDDVDEISDVDNTPLMLIRVMR